MKKIYFIFLFFCFTSFSQTQAEMNADAFKMYQETDKVLSDLYNKMLLDYCMDESFVSALRKSQMTWKQFRAAELEMKFPERELGYYGTMHPLCKAMFLKNLTEDRITTLKDRINSITEGNTCN